MTGGTISTGVGSIASNVHTLTTLASSTTATITGNFNLFGGSTITVASGTTSSGIDLDMQAALIAGAVEKSGSGLLNLSGNNTFTSGLIIDAGVVRVANAGALNSTTPQSVTFNTSSTGTLRLNGNSVTIAGLSTNATVGTPVVENANATAATLTVDSPSNFTYAGVIRDGTGGGTLALAKNGVGSLTLAGTGANAYTGTTTGQCRAFGFSTRPRGRMQLAETWSSAAAPAQPILLSCGSWQAIKLTRAHGNAINQTGWLDLNGNSDDPASVTLVGGNISTGSGTLETDSSTLTSLASSTIPSSVTALSGKFDMFNLRPSKISAWQAERPRRGLIWIFKPSCPTAPWKNPAMAC